MRILWLGMWLLLSAIFLPGQGPFESEGNREFRPPAVARPVYSDESLQRAIAKRFAASKIGVNHFTVTVKNGIATLHGSTQVSQHKGVATRLARAAGARSVINRITICGRATGKLRRSSREGGGESKPKSPLTPDRPETASQKAGSANLQKLEEFRSEASGGASNTKEGPIKEFRVVGHSPRGTARTERYRRY